MKYLLPKELGGGEVTLFQRSNRGDGKSLTVVVDGGGPQFEIHENWLTPVPELPTEPPPGAYQIGAVVAVRLPTFEDEYQHMEGDDWFVPSLAHEGSVGPCWMDWGNLWRKFGGPDVTIRRLVPEPAKVELPWLSVNRGGYGCSVSITDGGSILLQVHDNAESVSPFLEGKEAANLGRALLVAADKVGVS